MFSWFKKTVDEMSWMTKYYDLTEEHEALKADHVVAGATLELVKAELEGYKTRPRKHVVVNYDSITPISIERHYIEMFKRAGTEVCYFTLGAAPTDETHSSVYDTTEEEHLELMEEFRDYLEKKAKDSDA